LSCFFDSRLSKKQKYGGHDHVIRNNIFVDTDARIPPGPDSARWSGVVQDPLQVLRLRKAVDILKPPYSSRYPGLADTFEGDPNYRRGNIVHDNLSVRSGDFGAGTNDMKDNLVTNEDPGFVDEAGMNFQLKPDAPVLAKMPGFRPTPFERVGLYIDEHRPVLPAEARRSGH
jgi:hypothetical protein